MRVLVVAGASGGHIFPAVAFLETLKVSFPEIKAILAMPSRSKRDYDFSDYYTIRYLSTVQVNLRLDLKNLIAILKFLKGSWESLFMLIKFKPDLVAGFGGVDSAPMLIFAWALRIKTLIHEQNVVPGKANKLLAKFVDRVAVSFPETEGFLNVNKDKVLVTGNPVRKKLKNIDKCEALRFLGLDNNKFTILVMGGSQGSSRINEVFLSAASGMQASDKVQVIHISGEKDYEILKKSYEGLKVKVKLFGFLQDMEYAYNASDIVVSRAGATTISELMLYNLPAILLPYPFAYKHQLNNARVMEAKGLAVLIEDNELDAAKLGNILNDFISLPEKVNYIRSQYSKISKTKANELLVDAAMQ